MVEAVRRVRCVWDVAQTTCRAAAYDVHDNLLGQLTLEIPPDTLEAIRKQWGPGASLRIEEIAEKQLRAMLELRH
jgi:hypothetical protein